MIATLRADEGAGPPVVYVPGIDGSGDMLLGTGPRLARRFRLVRLRYEPRGADDYGALAASVAGRLDELGIPRALVLAESFGVAVALRLALDHGERVTALALVNGFARHPWRLRLFVSRLGASLVRGPLFEAGRRVLAPWALFGPGGDAEARRRFRALPGVAFDAGYRARLRMVRGLDLRPRLAEVRVPVALFASDRDRIVPSVRTCRAIEARVPDVTLEVLPGAGHLVLPLHGERWVRRLEALAERAPAASSS